MLRVHSIESLGTHDGPGLRLVIFLQGCNFTCKYCQNPDTQEATGSHQLISSQEIITRLENQRPYIGKRGGLTVSGGEPTLQAKALIELFKLAHQAGFHTALDTNGSITTPAVKELYAHTDLLLFDLKHIDDAKHIELTGQSNRNVLEMAEYAREKDIPMWLRYVLVPNINDSELDLHNWAKHFKDYKNVEKVEILPYHNMAQAKYDQLNWPYPLADTPLPTTAQIQMAKEVFSKYFQNVTIHSL